MQRRAFLGAMTGLLAAPLVAEAQQAVCGGSLSYAYHRSSQSDLPTGRAENG